MGIGGVTYTDGRGRKRNLDVNSLEDFKAQFGAAARTPRQRVTPQLPAPGAAQPQPNAAPDTMPGSAVVNTRNGLALKGEENDPTVPGKKVYGSVDGVKGYHTLDEIDPLTGGGRRVGHDGSVNDASDETPDGDSVQGFDGQGFDVPLASRIALTGGENGVYTLYQFTRDLRFSSGRRAGGVSAEEKKEIGTILIPADSAADAPDYPFAVKMVSSDSAGNEKYGIYLPPNILYVADEQPDFTTELNAVQDMSAWYELPDGHNYGPVYLHVTLPYDEEPVTGETEGGHHDAEAEIVTAADEPGEHDLYIEIADIGDDGVVQKVVGSLVIGKSADGGSTPEPPEPVAVPVPDEISVDYTSAAEQSGGGGDGEADGETAGENDGEGDSGGSSEGDDFGTSGDGEPEQQKLQIKDWDNDESNDSNDLATLMSPGSDGEAHSENGDYEIVVRKDGAGGELKYLPLGTLETGEGGGGGNDGKDAGLKIETEEAPTSEDGRNGVKITLTPTLDGVEQTEEAEEFTLYNGKDGADGEDSTVPGPQGVGISNVSSGTPTSSGGYTTTPVTVTLTNNTTASFNVTAKDGADGADSTVPGPANSITVSHTSITGGRTVTITPETGTADSFNVMDGVSPTASVTKSGKTATITITDKNGTTTQTVSDGKDATVEIDKTSAPVSGGHTGTRITFKAKSGGVVTDTEVVDVYNGADGTPATPWEPDSYVSSIGKRVVENGVNTDDTELAGDVKLEEGKGITLTTKISANENQIRIDNGGVTSITPISSGGTVVVSALTGDIDFKVGAGMEVTAAAATTEPTAKNAQVTITNDGVTKLLPYDDSRTAVPDANGVKGDVKISCGDGIDIEATAARAASQGQAASPAEVKIKNTGVTEVLPYAVSSGTGGTETETSLSQELKGSLKLRIGEGLDATASAAQAAHDDVDAVPATLTLNNDGVLSLQGGEANAIKVKGDVKLEGGRSITGHIPVNVTGPLQEGGDTILFSVPVGTGSNQAARGNHTHNIYIPTSALATSCVTAVEPGNIGYSQGVARFQTEHQGGFKGHVKIAAGDGLEMTANDVDGESNIMVLDNTGVLSIIPSSGIGVNGDVNFEGASGNNVVPVLITGQAGSNGGNDKVLFGVPTGTTAGTVAAGNHTHSEYAHPSTTTIAVITGISFGWENNELKATITKSTLTVHGAVAVQNVPKETLSLWKQDVDSGSAYSEGTNKFTKVVMPGVRTVETAPTATTDVFEAVSHDDEYGGS